MKEISVGDKIFQLYIEENSLQKIVKNLAKKISDDLKDKKPLFLPILNGSFMFASDLFKCFDFPAEISFIKIASYEGTSVGEVKEFIGIDPSCAKGRIIVIIEDILETGTSLSYAIQKLKDFGASEVLTCCLFSKADCLKKDIEVKYLGKNIPNDFIIGYGMDYNGLGRNLKEIYQLKN